MVGEPRSLWGERGAQARAAAGFAGRLRARVEVPVELWDERLTTVEASRRCARGGIPGRPRQPRGLRPARGLPGGPPVSRAGYRRPAAAAAGPGPPVLLVVVMIAAVGWALAGRRSSDDPTPASAPSTTAPAQRLLIREGLRREDVAPPARQETSISGDRYLALTGPGARGRALAGTRPPHLARGLPVPRDVRHHGRHHGGAAGGRAARGVPGQHRRRRITAYAASRTSQVRRPDDRLDDRARGGRAPASGPWWRASSTTGCTRGMRLDIDATVQYAIGEWKPDLTAADLASDTPTTPAASAACRPGPSPAPARTASGPRPTPPRRSTSTTWPATTGAAATTSRDAAQLDADVARSQANGH